MIQASETSGRGRSPTRHWMSGIACGFLLCACSPTLDWRQVRPEGWGLDLAMPCRPSNQVRQVPLAGSAVELNLLACGADAHTYAVASADMADPARVGPALQALGDAARVNVQGVVEAERAATVPGMTPQSAARHWVLRGKLPDGTQVREQVVVFAHGLRVFQASLVGPAADEARGKPFFESIELTR